MVDETQDLGSQEQAAPEMTPEVQEKMLRQSDVNRIVHERTRSVAQKAEERGYQRAMQELASPQQPAMQQPSMQSQATQPSVDEITHQVQQQLQAQMIFQTFLQKMIPGKEKYADFDQKVGTLLSNPKTAAAMTPIVELVSGLDNASDVMYDLSSDLGKTRKVLDIIDTFGKEAGAKEMWGLAESIKRNENAKAEPKSPEPLDRLTTDW